MRALCSVKRGQFTKPEKNLELGEKGRNIVSLWLQNNVLICYRTEKRIIFIVILKSPRVINLSNDCFRRLILEYYPRRLRLSLANQKYTGGLRNFTGHVICCVTKGLLLGIPRAQFSRMVFDHNGAFSQKEILIYCTKIFWKRWFLLFWSSVHT